MRGREGILRLSLAAVSLVLSLSGAAPVQAQRIFLVGDSISVSGIDELQAGTRSLPYRLQRAIPEKIVTLYGRPGWSMSYNSGYLVSQMSLEGLTAQLLASDVVAILLGHNDFSASAPIADFESSYLFALDNIRFWMGRPLCITPIPVQTENSANRLGLTLEDYRESIRAVCTAAGIPVIEGPELIAYESRFYSDWNHLSLAGTRRLAKTLAQALRENVPELSN